MVRKIIFQYVGMPEKSEFSEEPLIPPSGKEIEKKVAFDEYDISILAPQEAAERFQKWLQHAVIKNNDYREMLIPMFKPAKSHKPLQLPLVGEELWKVVTK